jgi:hypothetical protein
VKTSKRRNVETSKPDQNRDREGAGPHVGTTGKMPVPHVEKSKPNPHRDREGAGQKTSLLRNRIRESVGHTPFAPRYSPFTHRGHRRDALSMVETLVSILLVGGLVVVSLDTLGQSARGQQYAADRGRAQHLAADLLSEIMQQYYHEPDYQIAELGAEAEVGITMPGSITVTFGVNVGEVSTDRSTFDDVDDYHNWSESPPKHRDGTTMAGFDDWKRSVIVNYVNPTSLNQTVSSDQGAKRIIVIVERNGVEITRMVGVKTGTPTTSALVDPGDLETLETD